MTNINTCTNRPPAFIHGLPNTRPAFMYGASNPNTASADAFATAQMPKTSSPFVRAISKPTTNDVPHAHEAAAEMLSFSSGLMLNTAFLFT